MDYIWAVVGGRHAFCGVSTYYVGMSRNTESEPATATTIIARTLVVGLLAIALVAVGLPALLGWKLAQVHDRYVQELAIPDVLEVRDSKFSRGLLRSRSRIQLALAPALCGDSTCPVITVNSTIYHGPIAFTAPPPADGSLPIGRGVIVSTIDLAPLFKGWSFQPVLPKLEAITRVSLDGATRTRVTLAGARLRAVSDDRAGRLVLKPLHASAQAPPSYDSLRADLSWPGLQWVADSGGQFEWAGLVAQATGNARTTAFWQTFQVGLERLQWVDAQGRALAFQGLRWDAQNTATNARQLAGKFDLRLSQLQTHNRQFGPVIIEGQAEGLDAVSIEALQADVRSLGTRSLPPALQIVVANAIYQTHIGALLAAQPQIQISRFLAGTPDGDISGNVQLGLTPAQQPRGTALAEVLQQLHLIVNLRLPSTLLHSLVQARLDRRPPPAKKATSADVDAVLEQLLKQKIVVARPKEAAYSIALDIQNQKMTLNGKLRKWWQDLLVALAQNSKTAEEMP